MIILKWINEISKKNIADLNKQKWMKERIIKQEYKELNL